MSAINEKIFIEALSLPLNARVELVRRLLTSLKGVDFADDVSETWRGEIESRRQDFATGKGKEVSADEALRRAEVAIG